MWNSSWRGACCQRVLFWVQLGLPFAANECLRYCIHSCWLLLEALCIYCARRGRRTSVIVSQSCGEKTVDLEAKIKYELPATPPHVSGTAVCVLTVLSLA